MWNDKIEERIVFPKLPVEKLPEKPSECLFCSVKENMAKCMLKKKFDIINGHEGQCICALVDGASCPYLKKREELKNSGGVSYSRMYRIGYTEEQ